MSIYIGYAYPAKANDPTRHWFICRTVRIKVTIFVLCIVIKHCHIVLLYLDEISRIFEFYREIIVFFNKHAINFLDCNFHS